MGKNKLSSGLINVVTYDTENNISLNSGSNLLMSLSGSGKVTIPGNLVVLGGISGSSAESSSYALNADKIDNLDSTQLVLTSSFNSYTSSASSSLGSLSGSVSSSIGSLSGSIATTTSELSSSIGSLSSSVATTTSGLAGRIGTIEGNYATTGSNTFIGTQTITGSLFISSNLIVQGSSSLQDITASMVNIGANIVNLNTANPAIRFAGLNIFDSGSIGGSGSFLYDSVQDEMIFVHRGDNANITSSVVLMGPQTYNNIGSEIYPTTNRILKGTGNEHVGDSIVSETGGGIGVSGSLSVTGSLTTTGTSTFSGNLAVNNTITATQSTAEEASIVAASGWSGTVNNPIITFGRLALAVAGQIGYDDPNTRLYIGTTTNHGLAIRTNNTDRISISSAGVACFSGTVCAPSFVGGTLSGTSSTVANSGTACAITDVLTLSTLQSGSDSVCAGAGIKFTGNAGATVARIYSRGNMNFNNGSDLVFQTQTSAGGGPQCTMVINGGSQNVGIGTFTPTDKLDIYGNDTNGAIVIRGGSSQTGRNIYLFSGGISATGTLLGVTKCVNQFIYSNNSRLTIGTADAHSLGFSTSDTLRAIIDSSGITCFVSTVCSPYLSTRSIEMGGSATSPSTACVGYGMFGYSGVGLGISATATGPNQGMGFFTCGDFERMRLTTSGNLGIGCTTPAYLLDVNGRTRLCGNVGIRVAPSSAGDQYLTTGDAGIAYSNSYFGTGQVRIGGGSDHASNTVFSVAPGVVTFDRPGVGGGALKIDGGGNVSINNATATAKFHAYGTTKLENYFYYGYAQSFVWQSVFNNPVQSLFTFNAAGAYSQTLIKVTFIQNGVSNGYAARYVGYAIAHLNPYTFNSSVTSMTAEYTNGPAAPTLSWSGQTLQITPQRATNYDGYVVFIEWGSNTNTNALPTVTM